MSNQEKYTEDILSRFINPEGIEKVPEGFTSKVMSRIQLETIPAKAAGRFRNINPVPVISAIVISILLVAAFLIPGSNSYSLSVPALEFLKNLKVSLPEIDLTTIFRYNLPATLAYVLIVLLILSLFDKALYRIFKREKQTKV